MPCSLKRRVEPEYRRDFRVIARQLVAVDGLAAKRRVLRFSRDAPDAQRIVVHGHAGIVTLDALRWMSDTGIAFVQLDSDRQLIARNVTGALEDVRIRRGQALASAAPQGVDIVRSLLAAKLDGQCVVLSDIGARVRPSASFATRATRSPTQRPLRTFAMSNPARLWNTGMRGKVFRCA